MISKEREREGEKVASSRIIKIFPFLANSR